MVEAVESELNSNKKNLFAQSGQISTMIAQGKLQPGQIPNPHWQKDACLACHTDVPVQGKTLLKSRNISRGCNSCHRHVAQHDNIHPTDIAIPATMRSRMPTNMRKTLGSTNKATCNTCHDPIIQCTVKRFSEKWRNKLFLKGGPYKNRTNICYQCHDKTAYSKLNPHDQISDQGQVQYDKCLICHRTVPREGDVTVTLQVTSDWAALCINCHKWTPHPGGNMAMFSRGKPPDHLVVPDAEIQARMKKMTKRNNIALPLEPGTGKVYCATCHNPHEKGIIKSKVAAAGADADKRLRVGKNICIYCHEK